MYEHDREQEDRYGMKVVVGLHGNTFLMWGTGSIKVALTASSVDKV